MPLDHLMEPLQMHMVKSRALVKSALEERS
jgi:hypothetical protein